MTDIHRHCMLVMVSIVCLVMLMNASIVDVMPSITGKNRFPRSVHWRERSQSASSSFQIPYLIVQLFQVPDGLSLYLGFESVKC